MDLRETAALPFSLPLKGVETQQKIDLWSLVLEAVHIPHQIVSENNGWVIHVAAEDFEVARHQVLSFEEENRNWPPPPPEAEPMGSDDFSTLIFMVSLVLFFSLFNLFFVNGSEFFQKFF